ncbi:MAG: S1C family serine protease [Puniceicoccales bacterium]
MFSTKVLLASLGVMPVMAIEPPVDSSPIPPQAPPKAVPAPAEAGRKAAPAMSSVEKTESLEVRPYIGVILDPIPDLLRQHLQLAPDEGVMISELVSGGPAEGAGLQVNDLLLGVDGQRVGSRDEVRVQVEKFGIGEEVELDVIQEGKRKTLVLTLGQAPALMPEAVSPPAPDMAGRGQLDGLLRSFSDEHADAIRRALDSNFGGDLQEELMQRMQRQMRGMQLNFGALEGESTIRLFDDLGSIEMRKSAGHTEAKVFDKQGELLWQGPFDTEEEKSEAPEGIRDRIERLDFNFEGNGLRMRMGPNRFRSLEDMNSSGGGEGAPAED